MWMRDSWDTFPSEAVRALMASCDGGVVCNLETVLHESLPLDPFWMLQARLISEVLCSKTMSRSPHPHFRQSLLPDMVTYSSPSSLLRAFRHGAGSHLAAVSTANNHCLDLGTGAIGTTLHALAAAGIPQSGCRTPSSPAQPWAKWQRGGLCGGLYACTFGVNLLHRLQPAAAAGVVVQTLPGLAAAGAGGAAPSAIDYSQAHAALQEMSAAGCELRVVSVHWGHEFEGYPTVLQMQVSLKGPHKHPTKQPAPCFKAMRTHRTHPPKVARELVAAGADIVLGAHAHLQQPWEVLDINGWASSEHCPAGEAAAMAALPACCRLSGAPGPPRKALVLYCAGNFCTTMFNEVCRVGLLATLQLHRCALRSACTICMHGREPLYKIVVTVRRLPTGRMDWALPQLHWLYNEAHVLFRPPFSTRKLLHICSDGGGSHMPRGFRARSVSPPPRARNLSPQRRGRGRKRGVGVGLDAVPQMGSSEGADARHLSKRCAPEDRAPCHSRSQPSDPVCSKRRLVDFMRGHVLGGVASDAPQRAPPGIGF